MCRTSCASTSTYSAPHNVRNPRGVILDPTFRGVNAPPKSDRVLDNCTWAKPSHEPAHFFRGRQHHEGHFSRSCFFAEHRGPKSTKGNFGTQRCMANSTGHLRVWQSIVRGKQNCALSYRCSKMPRRFVIHRPRPCPKRRTCRPWHY